MLYQCLLYLTPFSLTKPIEIQVMKRRSVCSISWLFASFHFYSIWKNFKYFPTNLVCQTLRPLYYSVKFLQVVSKSSNFSGISAPFSGFLKSPWVMANIVQDFWGSFTFEHPSRLLALLDWNQAWLSPSLFCWRWVSSLSCPKQHLTHFL